MALGQFSAGLYGRVTIIGAAEDSHSTNVSGNVHGAVSAATNNMIVRRDSSGRADIVAPAASDSTSKIPTTAWVQNELGIGGFGTVLNVATGTGLTGGPIVTTGTVSIDTTGVSAGSYTLASITVNAQGQLTAASSGSSAVTNVTGTSPITSTGGSTPAIGIPAATGSVNGYMSSTDKTKLDNATQAATASRLCIRDGSGRLEVQDPVSGDDVLNFVYWEANRVKDVGDLTGITISTGAPSGGSDGDLWFQY